MEMRRKGNIVTIFCDSEKEADKWEKGLNFLMCLGLAPSTEEVRVMEEPLEVNLRPGLVKSDQQLFQLECAREEDRRDRAKVAERIDRKSVV